eukprot:g47683.t1
MPPRLAPESPAIAAPLSSLFGSLPINSDQLLLQDQNKMVAGNQEGAGPRPATMQQELNVRVVACSDDGSSVGQSDSSGSRTGQRERT